MQTRTYGDLFKLIQSLAGVGSFAPTEADDVANLINRRFQQAFDESPVWPRYFVSSEERALALYELSGATSTTSTAVNAQYKFFGINSGSFETGGGSATADTNIYVNTSFDPTASGASTYIYKNSSNAWVVSLISNPTDTRSSDGKISLHEAGTVQFTEADTNKNDTVEGVTTWTPRAGNNLLSVEVKNTIPYTEKGIMIGEPAKTTIGEFNRIHRKKAFLNQSAIEYDFFVDFDGANILNITSTTDNSAFVSYKKEFTPFTVTGSTVEDFTNSTVEVPAEFFAYLAHATYADFLRMDGQTDKAFSEENTASIALALELEKIDIISNNNTVNKRFSTYVNRQSR